MKQTRKPGAGRKPGKTVEKISGLRLSPDMHERLTRLCNGGTKQKSYYMRKALEQYLDAVDAVRKDLNAESDQPRSPDA